MSTMSACFPTSRLPSRSDAPRDMAPLIVGPPWIASSGVIRIWLQAIARMNLHVSE